MISVKVDQLLLSPVGFAVILKAIDDERSLPIVIGASEAQSIAIWLNHVEAPRPLTHDLMKNVLDFLECRLMRIEVHDLKNNTFYADLILEQNGEERKMDTRPSDAIALALRCGAHLSVSEAVMDKAGVVFPEEDMKENAEGSFSSGNNIDSLEALNTNLESAIKEERYEDAAKLRDEIRRIESTHTDN
jgi:bifunctional DNase/RNase